MGGTNRSSFSTDEDMGHYEFGRFISSRESKRKRPKYAHVPEEEKFIPIDEKPKSLISNKKLFLFGIVLISGIVVMGTDFDEIKVAQQYIGDTEITTSITDVLIPSMTTRLVESANTKEGLCTTSSCDTVRYEIKNMDDCAEMITLWEKHTAWTLRPTLAAKILNTCEVP